MASSAFADFFATQAGGTFKYVFLIRNTSTEPFDLYSVLIGAQYEVAPVSGGLRRCLRTAHPACA